MLLDRFKFTLPLRPNYLVLDSSDPLNYALYFTENSELSSLSTLSLSIRRLYVSPRYKFLVQFKFLLQRLHANNSLVGMELRVTSPFKTKILPLSKLPSQSLSCLLQDCLLLLISLTTSETSNDQEFLPYHKV